MTSLAADPAVGGPAPDSDLASIERRVLWLATSMIHHANKVRTTTSGLKVGGHQASSASMASIMTALYFDHLEAGDRVSVKPHASPVLHAVNYLLGRLDRSYLTELRAYGGLQSYPSRTKDPDPVDFSTGSVGIGATATIWSALASRYVSGHLGARPVRRHIALVGDAELDEGAVWEALVDPMVPNLGEVMWVVDLNRQSLDRIVPKLAATRLEAMFAAAGWHTVTVKYGRRLRELFARDGGEALRTRIDAMSNAEYQKLLRTPLADLRERLAADARLGNDVRRVTADLDDRELGYAVRDLGGHDLADLKAAYQEADRVIDRPTVVFAYTIKARGLPTEGHPENHSALLSTEQWEQLGRDLGADPAAPWAPFDERSREAALCRRTAERLAVPTPRSASSPASPPAATPESAREAPADLSAVTGPPQIPVDLGRPHRGVTSTQQAFGRIIVDLHRAAPEVGRRLVTVSPDVASSTNLGGWINKVGVWTMDDRVDWFADDGDTALRWRESGAGQHIELGIAEGNLVGLLSELGVTWSRDGQPLLPIGSMYDPFVNRALEPWSFGIYAGGQSILVGTPSGITLAPEGGAHQSIISPSVGLEQPDCIAWEPAFGQDLEWCLLHALSLLGRPGGSSSYFRLSSRPVDQALAPTPAEPVHAEALRRDAVAGGYLLRRVPDPRVVLVGTGALMTEVVRAADELARAGVEADVVCVTSADLLFRAFQARRGLQDGPSGILDRLFRAGRAAPLVTVLDGHPHTLSFLGAVAGAAVSCLGVSGFGQVGDVDDLYRHYGIDAAAIVGAAWDLLDEQDG